MEKKMVSIPVNTGVQDVGLRNYFVSIYNNMTMGLLFSGGIAYWMSTNAALMATIWKTPLAYAVIFAPLVLSLGFMFLIERISAAAARVFFYVFAATMGASLSSIFLIYQLGSIFQVFFITSATFLTMSVYGYTTKKDLNSLGSFLMMGVIGIILAGIVNLFLQSSALAFAVSCIAVIVFTLLVAFDTQQLKDTYYTTYGEEREKLGVVGALSLYINFINIFISLLQILGNKNSD
jgi:FtsH-binding integral membrane protein